MNRSRRTGAPSATIAGAPLSSRLILGVLLAGVVLIPLWYSPGGNDVFRLPKLLLLRAESLVLVTLLIWRRPAVNEPGVSLPLFEKLALAGGAWALASALFAASGSRALDSLFVIGSCAVVYLAAKSLDGAERRRVVVAVIAVAVLQSALGMLQSIDLWVPFVWTFQRAPLADPLVMRVAPLALLGNRNDFGVFLVLPALAAAATWCSSVRRGERMVLAGALLVLFAGLVASRTLTAMLATIAGLAVIALLRSPRAALLFFGATAVVAITLTIAYSPLRARADALRSAVASRNFDLLLTQRVAAYAAAADMVRSHPITGVGPGQFASAYFDHKIAGVRRWPGLVSAAGSEQNFSEAHDEPLQIAAEYGLPGLVLFLLMLASFARTTFAAREQVPHLFGPAAAAALFVASLAQFPLRLGAVLVVMASLAGITMAWSRDEESQSD